MNKGTGLQDGIKPLPFAPLSAAAYHGLAGDYAGLIEPFTEADPATILVQFLVLFGNAAGRRAYRTVENDRHYTNLFCVLIGGTADSRKGSSFGQAKRLFDLAADSGWTIKEGLVSGEGVVHHVRDRVERDKFDKTTGTTTRVIVDSGVSDKRLMAVEAEFARVLTNAGREGSALSTTIRKAWDSGNLGNLTRQSPEVATDAHISLIGHVTPEELTLRLSETDLFNGFANRILWIHSRRTKFLAFAEKPAPEEVTPLAERLSAALKFARSIAEPEISFTPPACAMFEAVYPQLTSSRRAGLLSVVLNRAAPQVIRLALIYMLLDSKSAVDEDHLRAALALWEYSERSALFYFGGATQLPIADKILNALRQQPNGLTRTEMTALFSNHGTGKISEALALLLQQQLAQFAEEKTAGRSVERWKATGKRLNEDAPSYLAALSKARFSKKVLELHAKREKRAQRKAPFKAKKPAYDGSDSPVVREKRASEEKPTANENTL
jgi:hypothetical protein